MDLTMIIYLVTVLVTFVCGLIAKRVNWFNNKLIPIQNLAIGIIVALIEWAITGDFNAALMSAGLLTGGSYELGKNLKELFNIKDTEATE